MITAALAAQSLVTPPLAGPAPFVRHLAVPSGFNRQVVQHTPFSSVGVSAAGIFPGETTWASATTELLAISDKYANILNSQTTEINLEDFFSDSSVTELKTSQQEAGKAAEDANAAANKATEEAAKAKAADAAKKAEDAAAAEAAKQAETAKKAEEAASAEAAKKAEATAKAKAVAEARAREKEAAAEKSGCTSS